MWKARVNSEQTGVTIRAQYIMQKRAENLTMVSGKISISGRELKQKGEQYIMQKISLWLVAKYPFMGEHENKRGHSILCRKSHYC
jgi:hypothetical protein